MSLEVKENKEIVKKNKYLVVVDQANSSSIPIITLASSKSKAIEKAFSYCFKEHYNGLIYLCYELVSDIESINESDYQSQSYLVILELEDNKSVLLKVRAFKHNLILREVFDFCKDKYSYKGIRIITLFSKINIIDLDDEY